MKDTWIVVSTALLDTLWAQAFPADVDTAIPDNVRLLLQSVRGHWANISPDEVINTSAPIEEVKAFMLAHGLTEAYSWNFSAGTDDFDDFPTNPTRLVALMPPHITYDVDGNILSTTPATLDNPNWAHSFAGGGNRIFAGAHSADFNEDFF